MSVVLNKESFETEVLKAETPVLVDFFATWCGPCKMLSPTLDELETEYEGKVKFVKVDIDQEPELTMSYGVMSVPTLMLFKGGQPAATTIGVQPKEDLVAFING